MKTLHLTLKKKWFDMVLLGEKKEEYREIKPYWIKRLTKTVIIARKLVLDGTEEYQRWPEEFDTVYFKNGYSKTAPFMLIECKGIRTGKAKPEWSDNWQGMFAHNEKCELIGQVSSITEEQWNGVVDEPDTFSYFGKALYTNYEHKGNWNMTFETATESGMSWLKANQIYTDTPLDNEVVGTGMSLDEALKMSDEREERTGNWVLLKQI